MHKVLVFMGSKSDKEEMHPCIDALKAAGVKPIVRVCSAHRALKRLIDIVEKTDAEAIIAGAGLAAALPGDIAAATIKPVIGMPAKNGPLNGFDALLSIVQMPPGIPVNTVGIGNSKNAAISALEMLAISDPELQGYLMGLRQTMLEGVIAADEEISAEFNS